MVFTKPVAAEDWGDVGNPETTSGGMALKFYASVRLDMRRIEAIKAGGEVLGTGRR